MITINNKTYRNLEEQVQKNMEDINKFAQGTQVLADFGIKIVGHIDDSSELPDPTEYDGDYGDAYIVGESDPYNYWIFTRAEVGDEDPYWFDLGPFPVPGPQGEQGPEGPIGETPNVNMQIGTVSTLNPDQSATVSVIPSGYGSDNPLFTLNFGLPKGQKGDTGATGPQGPTGPQGQKGDKGDKGDQGGLIEIVGIVSDANLLPTPASLDKLDAAYLVGEEGDYELYIQVGDNPATAIWTNIGYFNAASVVTVAGVPQDTWEADSKVSVSEGHLVNTLYGQISGTGNGQVHVPYSNTASGNAIVQRDANGQVIVPETPTANGMAASKKYVDDKAASILPLQYKGDLIVGDTGGVAERLALGSANQFLQVNSQGNGLTYSYVNQVPTYSSSDSEKVLAVNSSGNALEWVTQSSGGGGEGTTVVANPSGNTGNKLSKITIGSTNYYVDGYKIVLSQIEIRSGKTVTTYGKSKTVLGLYCQGYTNRLNICWLLASNYSSTPAYLYTNYLVGQTPLSVNGKVVLDGNIMADITDVSLSNWGGVYYFVVRLCYIDNGTLVSDDYLRIPTTYDTSWQLTTYLSNIPVAYQ